jgi:hypothetical protein
LLLTLPSSVTYIGDRAFDNANLASITIPNNAFSYIGKNAFALKIGCAALYNGSDTVFNSTDSAHVIYRDSTTKLFYLNLDSTGKVLLGGTDAVCSKVYDQSDFFNDQNGTLVITTGTKFVAAGAFSATQDATVYQRNFKSISYSVVDDALGPSLVDSLNQYVRNKKVLAFAQHNSINYAILIDLTSENTLDISTGFGDNIVTGFTPDSFTTFYSSDSLGELKFNANRNSTEEIEFRFYSYNPNGLKVSFVDGNTPKYKTITVSPVKGISLYDDSTLPKYEIVSSDVTYYNL